MNCLTSTGTIPFVKCRIFYNLVTPPIIAGIFLVTFDDLVDGQRSIGSTSDGNVANPIVLQTEDTVICTVNFVLTRKVPDVLVLQMRLDLRQG